jgi:amino acid transporter
VQWSTKFVDPAAGFAVGWAYWFNYFITIANELQAVNTVLKFWTDAVPIAAWMTIFWVVIILVNVGECFYGVLFSDFCRWHALKVLSTGLAKSKWFALWSSSAGSSSSSSQASCVPRSITPCWPSDTNHFHPQQVISAGGAATESIGFRYWNETPFLNGFKGFLSVMPTCIFAMAGSENAGLVAAETKNPRRSVPKAVASIWIRLSLFYILGSLIITINVSPLNEDIFGGTGTNASPFVIMYRQAGVQPLAHMMNAVIFISVLSTGTISGFAGSRTLLGLSQIGMAPKVRLRRTPYQQYTITNTVSL